MKVEFHIYSFVFGDIKINYNVYIQIFLFMHYKNIAYGARLIEYKWIECYSLSRL
jgi:hypothetical protein